MWGWWCHEKLKLFWNSLLGNPNDKIVYARSTKRSSSFPVSARLERRHSLRLFGSSKRLSSSLTRCGSMRHISNKHLLRSDSSSSTEYPSTDGTNGSKLYQCCLVAEIEDSSTVSGLCAHASGSLFEHVICFNPPISVLKPQGLT